MLATFIKDIDIIILSYLDLNILKDIELKSYFIDIFNDNYFWKLKLKNVLGITSIDDNINYQEIYQFLDNDKSLKENYYRAKKDIVDQLIS